jgi:hypothetical protein
MNTKILDRLRYQTRHTDECERNGRRTCDDAYVPE